MKIRLLPDGAHDVENGRYFNLSDMLKGILKQFSDFGEEVLETIKHRARLSTIFDAYTEKVIPTFVNEKDLKKHYEKRMEEVNEFIYKF